MPQAQFTIDWHTIEKAVWIVGTAFVTALVTIARPWLAKQILKLLKEDKGAYKEFGLEMWADTFKKLDKAAEDASHALNKVSAMKERLEKAESAIDEQGSALAEMQEVPERVTRMGLALEAFMHEHNELKILTARIEERQKKTGVHTVIPR